MRNKLLEEIVVALIDEAFLLVSKHINGRLTRLRNKVSPPQTRFPIYSMGEAGPTRIHRKGYSSFSGVDIKVCLNDPDEPCKEEVEVNGQTSTVYKGQLGTVQGVSFGKREDTKQIGGTIIFLVFDNFDEIESFRGSRKRLVMYGSTEFGQVVKMVDKIIEFDQYYSWGISVDDLVTEVRIDFTEEEDKYHETD